MPKQFHYSQMSNSRESKNDVPTQVHHFSKGIRPSSFDANPFLHNLIKFFRINWFLRRE